MICFFSVYWIKLTLFYIFRTLGIFPKFQTSILIWLSGDNVSDLNLRRLLDESWLFSVVSEYWNIPKFRTRSFVLSSDFSLRYLQHMALVVCFFVVCYDSNAMTFSNYFSNFVIVCVDFLCLDFRCAVGSRNPKIAFSAVVVDSINFSSFQCHRDVAAPRLPRERPPTKIAMALQQGRACTSRRWLPLFSRADLIWLNVAICLRLCCRATNLP